MLTDKVAVPVSRLFLRAVPSEPCTRRRGYQESHPGRCKQLISPRIFRSAAAVYCTVLRICLSLPRATRDGSRYVVCSITDES